VSAAACYASKSGRTLPQAAAPGKSP
jgi:hypothetical protein